MRRGGRLTNGLMVYILGERKWKLMMMMVKMMDRPRMIMDTEKNITAMLP